MRNHPNPNPSNPSPSFSRFIGCDVGKASLVFFQTGDAATHAIANDRASIKAFAATLDPGCFLVCEATGGYEALLLSVWTSMGRAAHRADARKVKAFIRSLGVLGKTDDIDARQLERYAKERHAILPLWQPVDPNRQKLQALVLTRQDMVADRVAWTNRLKAPGVDNARSHMAKILKCLQAQITAIEAEIDALIKKTASLRQSEQVLSAIPGIGARTAATLLALMPELGTMDRRQAAALAGLAPHPQKSGATDAYRRTKGGRPLVKKALFLAAMSAAKNHPQLKLAHQRLREAGKKPMVALTAIMRKLIVIANAKLRDSFKEGVKFV